MLIFRKSIIIIIDLIILLWLLKVILLDKSSDVVGLFTVLTIIFLLLYNAYAYLVYKVYFRKARNNFFTEALYVFLLIVPIILLWRYTK
jgi:hypothetical protein